LVLSITKDQFKTRPSASASIAFAYQVNWNGACLENIHKQLLYKISFKAEQRASGLHLPHTVVAEVAIGLAETDRTSTDVIVGAVVGFPQCGKTTFFNTLLNLNKSSLYEELPVMETPYLHRFPVNNFTYTIDDQNNTVTKNLVFIDSRGYYFDLISSKDDRDRLDKFVGGLKSGTFFSKKIRPDDMPVDKQNSPTHLVLVSTAPDMFLYALLLVFII
jgi:hypothetical protein